MQRRSASTWLAATLVASGCGLASEEGSGARGPWMGGAPNLGELNGDGVEDLLAVFAQGGLTAFNGANYEVMWTRPDLSFPLRKMAVAGGSVVLVLPRAIEVLDATNGATRATIALTDEVQQLCVEGAKVAVHQIDKVTWTLDAATGQRDDGAAPPACKPVVTSPYLCGSVGHARCEGKLPSDNVRLTDPDTGVSASIEFKTPGTPEVTVVGYDAAGQPSFRSPFDPTGKRVEAVDLFESAVYVLQSGDVTAIDARAGTKLWTSSCRGLGTTLVVTASRVYFECQGHKSAKALRVVDRATGAVLTEVGTVAP